MGRPDYSQIAEDHASLLVLVRPIGESIKPKTFNRLFERISQLDRFGVPKPHRNVRFKYTRSYTKEESSWGGFQAHRRVLGLITIGKCGGTPGLGPDSPQETRSGLVSLHRRTAEEFEDSLLDSILIVLDGSHVASDGESTPEGGSVGLSRAANGGMKAKIRPDGSCVFGNGDENEEEEGAKVSARNGPETSEVEQTTTMTATTNGDMSASHVWFFRGESECESELEAKMQDFFNSLFWVLESKRMDRSQERSDNFVLLTAPPEREAQTGVEAESSPLEAKEETNEMNIFKKRAYKKKCLGRYKKQLGDLSLLAGIPGEASLHYQTCLDTLRTTNDWLWIAGAQEGLAVASYLILKPKSGRPSVLGHQNFSRNVSFSSSSSSASGNSSGGGKRPASRSRDSSLAATLQAAAASTLQSGLDLANNRVTTSVTTEILHEDILTNYKEAIINYSKVKESSIIEMEASIKACRILAMYRRTIDASDFLQNVVKINAQLTDDEKVEQFTTLSGLYSQLGLRRKSAFYSRVAAMVCVAPSNRSESWSRCYSLLLQSLPGFGLSLDYRDMLESPDAPVGWPSVKLRVMHELMYSRKRIGDADASVRHVCLLLQTMFDHLSQTERVELCTIVQSFASKYPSINPGSMALEDGTILPPAPLFSIPALSSFEVSELPASQRLHEFKRDPSGRPRTGTEDGAGATGPSHPFIYSPFINSSLEVANKIADKNKEITWVEGSTCHVCMRFKNPLPVGLQVDNVDLLVEGSKVEVQPTSFSMTPMSESAEIRVPVTPLSVGSFSVVGYSWEAFGVKSTLRFKELRQIGIKQGRPLDTTEDARRVRVEPRSPYLQAGLSSTLVTAETSADDREGGPDLSASPTGSLVIYAGQRHNFKVILTNFDMTPVERVDLLKSSEGLDEDCLDLLIRCPSEEEGEISGRLPVNQGRDLELEFQVDGLMDFVVAGNGSGKSRKETKSDDDDGGIGRKSLAKRFAAPDLQQRRERLLRLVRNRLSPGGTLKTDLTLTFQYAGGEGRERCRQCSLVVPLFVLPSISILAWRVLPGKSPETSTLALELKNSTELSLEVRSVAPAAAGGEREEEGEGKGEVEGPRACTIEPGRTSWIHQSLARTKNDPRRTGADPSLPGFDLLHVSCEEYRERLAGHLREIVDIRWRMPVAGAEGRLPLGDIPFSTEECGMLQAPLLSWGIHSDGGPTDSPFVLDLEVVQCRELKVVFKNETDFKFHDFVMRLSVGNDPDDRSPEGNDCSDSLLLIGSSCLAQEVVLPGKTTEHPFSVLFTRPSVRSLLFRCQAFSLSPLDSSMASSHSTVLQPSTSSSAATLTYSGSAEKVARRTSDPEVGSSGNPSSSVELPKSGGGSPEDAPRGAQGPDPNTPTLPGDESNDDLSNCSPTTIVQRHHRWTFVMKVTSRFSSSEGIFDRDCGDGGDDDVSDKGDECSRL